MGGAAFSMNMLWAQIMPFVALQLYDGDEVVKDAITTYLAGSFSFWVVLNAIFFRTIDLKYLKTFFGTMTAP